ncbi:hypothetical protein IQ16_08202 [Bradyrhizobium huanghuaihaiense]|uniref:Uncharacterized protein n=1 Tax=Bradyrhizobium huanghuaihaiense TaxID=990078 RepID=A0A562QQE6_9BRAD|nr:hypothetical protein [Bradyrhizobium huanghuaihaiense]TWI58296.1 hypothetical protein IQ16_08202 [Bradyrhizobium huanghuaihaiense]
MQHFDHEKLEDKLLMRLVDMYLDMPELRVLLRPEQQRRVLEALRTLSEETSLLLNGTRSSAAEKDAKIDAALRRFISRCVKLIASPY